MARSRYEFDEAKIAKRLKEGRGAGAGVTYLPWLTVQDVPSKGRSHRFVGRVTGRKHHLLSDLELRALLIYDWSDAVTDIREQFPLDRDDTRRIASTMGVAHPIDGRSKVDLVMTTDIVIDFATPEGVVTVARAVKPSSELEKARTLEKLEIERRYWAERGIDWGIVTERELPEGLCRNLGRLAGYRSIDEGAFPGIVDRIDREHSAWTHTSLREFCTAMDARFALETGRTLEIVLHLLATKVWGADLNEMIDETTPLTRFTRRPTSTRSASA